MNGAVADRKREPIMATTDAPVRTDYDTIATPDAAPGTGVTPPPDVPGGAVWDALTATPGASVADIAAAAGMSSQVARRTLITLEDNGHATRTPGGRKDGKRAP